MPVLESSEFGVLPKHPPTTDILAEYLSGLTEPWLITICLDNVFPESRPSENDVSSTQCHRAKLGSGQNLRLALRVTAIETGKGPPFVPQIRRLSWVGTRDAPYE